MKSVVRKLYWISSQQLGIDPLRFARFFAALPWFIRDLLRFRRGHRGGFELLPCLHDRREQSGAIATEYFAQDLLVAQRVFEAGPALHVDIGSRIDGFVAHVASFRSVRVFDIRPNEARVANIEFVQADLMSPPESMLGSLDSLSCLHTLEHFGLGRYGDPLDPNGSEKGLRGMAALLADDGTFYLSVPIGRARVAFNAHRVFDPLALRESAAQARLLVEQIYFIDPKGGIEQWDGSERQLGAVAERDYTLGVFVFRKARSAERTSSGRGSECPC